MSKRHQASRRRTYGRRQHELRERQDRDQRPDEVDLDLVEDGLSLAEAARGYRAQVFGATWLGLE